MANKGGAATAGYAGPVEQRLADLEDRVRRLEAASSPTGPAEPGDPGPGAGPESARARAGAGPAAGAAPGAGAGPAADAAPGGPGGGPGPKADGDVFWALHGLQERVGQPGAVLFTGTVALPGGAYYEWQEGRLAGDLLDADWTESATGLTALAHPVRLLLLREVLHGAQTAAQLSAHPSLGTSGQLYHHLRLLVSAGWLRSSARGQYDVPADRVVPLLTILAATR